VTDIFDAKPSIEWGSPFSEAFLIPPDDPEADERCRAIERGAKLITVMPTSFSLVLQMPRGNLETIFPRALVLAGIRRAISSTDYKTAFLACRSHRVDMNILHDHAPVQFMSNVGVFIDQVRKVEHIDLFLSQLKCASPCSIM
jgi:elongator complex protein 1